MSTPPAPILNYATPKPVSHLRTMALWLLTILVLYYAICALLCIPSFFSSPGLAAAIFSICAALSLTYCRAVFRISAGSWRWIFAAWLTVLVNLTLVILVLVAVVWDSFRSSSHAASNLQDFSCNFGLPGAITPVLTVTLYKLQREMKRPRTVPPTPAQAGSTSSE